MVPSHSACPGPSFTRGLHSVDWTNSSFSFLLPSSPFLLPLPSFLLPLLLKGESPVARCLGGHGMAVKACSYLSERGRKDRKEKKDRKWGQPVNLKAHPGRKQFSPRIPQNSTTSWRPSVQNPGAWRGGVLHSNHYVGSVIEVLKLCLTHAERCMWSFWVPCCISDPLILPELKRCWT